MLPITAMLYMLSTAVCFLHNFIHIIGLAESLKSSLLPLSYLFVCCEAKRCIISEYFNIIKFTAIRYKFKYLLLYWRFAVVDFAKSVCKWFAINMPHWNWNFHQIYNQNRCKWFCVFSTMQNYYQHVIVVRSIRTERTACREMSIQFARNVKALLENREWNVYILGIYTCISDEFPLRIWVSHIENDFGK